MLFERSIYNANTASGLSLVRSTCMTECRRTKGQGRKNGIPRRCFPNSGV